MEDNTETSNSAFNEASFKMKRIHELQERMNILRQRPMGKSKFGGFCFRSHRDCLTSLYQEIVAKCSTTERKDIKEKLTEIRKVTRELIQRTTGGDLAANWGTEIKSDKKYELSHTDLKYKVIDLISDCEEEIRILVDKHGFSTLNMESLEGDSYN